MDKYQQAILLILRSQNPDEAKQVIYQTASGISSARDPLVEAIKQVIKAYLMKFNIPHFSEADAETYAEDFARQLEVTLEVLKQEGFIPPCGLGCLVDPADSFLLSILGLIANITDPNNNSPISVESVIGGILVGDPCSPGCQVVRQLYSFLAWMANDPSFREQGFGTLQTAFNVTKSGINDPSWYIKGFVN